MRYMIELLYSFVKGADGGIYQGFIANDPEESPLRVNALEQLAEMLRTTPEDCDFNGDSIFLELPKTLVRRIEENAVKQYLAEQHEK